MFRCIWLEFRPVAVDSQGRPHSYEPAKWYFMFHEGHVPEMKHIVRACWLSPHRTSLNLQVVSHADLNKFNYLIPGILKIGDIEDPQVQDYAVLPFFRATVHPFTHRAA